MSQSAKIIIIGDSGVGKTSIMTQFADNNFSDSFLSTIGVDFRTKTIKIDNKDVKLQIWDTAGQERFRTITSAYYRGANGIILVYSVDDVDSFNHIEEWLNDIDKYTEGHVPILLVANKCDLAHYVVSVEMGEQFAIKNSINFIETSAKTNTNISSAFETLAGEITKSFKEKNNGISLPIYKEKKKRFECVIL